MLYFTYASVARRRRSQRKAHGSGSVHKPSCTTLFYLEWVIILNKQTIKLSEGVNLNIIQSDKFKTNFLSIDFLCRASAEDAAKNALIPRVLLQGTESYPDMRSIQTRLEELYSAEISPTLARSGDITRFGFAAYMLDNSYTDGEDVTAGVLDMLNELIFHPRLSEEGLLCEEYVKLEGINLANDIRAQINNKPSYALRRAREELLRGDAAASPEAGTPEEAESVTARELTEQYRCVIDHACVEIYFVGRADTDMLCRRFGETFGASTSREVSDGSKKLKRRNEPLHEVVEMQPVTQAKLSLGFITDRSLADGDYSSFVLAREIFGGSPSSKLFVNVREKLSLCYYCSAIPDSLKGTMIVTSGIEEANFDPAKNEILAQLEAMKRCEITEEELDAAKKSLINGYRELGDDAGSLKSWYFTRGLIGRSDSPEEAAEAISRLTAEDAARAFANIELDTVYLLKSNGEAPVEEGYDE